MAITIQKAAPVTRKQWDRVENAVEKPKVMPNQLLVELAMEALDRRECPRTEAEIYLLRPPMFTAQAIARDMIANGHRGEVEKIRRKISQFVPFLPD